MKQLLILSGKGGTGKTTIASAFIKLAKGKAYADCDVDAPNLHLLMEENGIPRKKDYYGLEKAVINSQGCIRCDICREKCRFGAILVDHEYRVDPFACEGCGVCQLVCPVSTISMKAHVDGELILYAREKEVFSTAKLKMGSGTSGLLVTEVKKQLKREAPPTDFAIIDGSPGIGCPVIASLSGVDTVLIVAEPSISGINDMKRIIDTARQFGIKIGICINKYDTNLEHGKKIEEYCEENKLEFLGRIPFDSDAVNAINNGQTIIDIDCVSGNAVKKLYNKTIELLFQEQSSETVV